MSTNFLNENNWKKLDMIEFGQNYSINLLTNEIRNDTTCNIRKPQLSRGYYRICLCMNGKQKKYLVHVLVWYAHNGLYDTKKYDIDHIDHCRTNNNIKNLRLVNRSRNNINRSHQNGKQFDYKDELPDAITINVDHGIYFCKTYDKFYRKVSEKQFRELRECKHSQHNGTYIQWQLNNKHYTFTTSSFRDIIFTK